jgi:hypothetical protein
VALADAPPPQDMPPATITRSRPSANPGSAEFQHDQQQ